MADPEAWRQLEQCRQRRSRRVESEQHADECEHEQRVPAPLPTRKDRSGKVKALLPARSRKDCLSSLDSEKPLASSAWYQIGKPVACVYFMKTFNNLFEHAANFDALYEAYLRSRKGKRKTAKCMEFELRLEENLINLLNHLQYGSYELGGYRSFLVHEPKTRVITALNDFEDRVVQHAVMAAIEPIWEARFISDSYACRVGKGTHKGADKAQGFLRDCLREHGKIYALKADIRRYFASIHHDTLKAILSKKIADKRMLELLFKIVDSYHELGRPGYGIPIGNLTSQLFANIYLNELDQYVKCRLRIKRYVRYMDDWVIISHDKEELQALRKQLSFWLADNLQLELNHKTQVFPVAVKNGRGLDFLGYHLWPHKRRLRKASLSRFKRRVRRLQRLYANREITAKEIGQQLASWIAHARHGDASAAIEKYLNEHPFIRSIENDDRNRNRHPAARRMEQRGSRTQAKKGIRRSNQRQRQTL